jgi:hypothetical protein
MVLVLMFWFFSCKDPVKYPDAAPASIYGVYADLPACLNGGRELMEKVKADRQDPKFGPF